MTVDLPKLADELARLAEAFRAHPYINGTVTLAPVMTPAKRAAYDDLRTFGQQLHDTGRGMMAAVYFEAIELHGPEAVRGVNYAWTGVGAWQE